MPQAKDLATVLGVDTNTVLWALRVLRDQRLLEVGRGGVPGSRAHRNGPRWSTRCESSWTWAGTTAIAGPSSS
jgi:hypothetical protein